MHSEPTSTIRCEECHREVDEFTALAERWRFWCVGRGELLPFCPECAGRGFAADGLAGPEVIVSNRAEEHLNR